MLARILICSLLVFIFSCSRKKEKINIEIRAKVSTVKMKLKINYLSKKNSLGNDIKYTKGMPAVSKLPFKSKDLARKAIYRLPTIKSIIYNDLDSIMNYHCTNGEPIDSGILKLTEYRYRLPDIGKYKVFYMFDPIGRFDKDVIMDFFKSNCNMYYDYFGYIILYDSITKNAIVLNVCNSYYIDAVEARSFYVDKNGIIHLDDRTWTDSGEDSKGNVGSEYLGSTKREIYILQDGEIKVINKY
jgi:hypothetical protein